MINFFNFKAIVEINGPGNDLNCQADFFYLQDGCIYLSQMEMRTIDVDIVSRFAFHSVRRTMAIIPSKKTNLEAIS
jgi:hypothetical protein